jgi:hypothetical protein
MTSPPTAAEPPAGSSGPAVSSGAEDSANPGDSANPDDSAGANDPVGSAAPGAPAGGRAPVVAPLLPEQSREDTDAAWGEYTGRDDDHLYQDRPPHWRDLRQPPPPGSGQVAALDGRDAQPN